MKIYIWEVIIRSSEIFGGIPVLYRDHRFGGNPKGGAPPLAWGASSLPLGRRSPSRSHLEGPAPFPLRPINRGVEGGQQHHIQGADLPLPTPPPPPLSLVKPCRRTATPSPPCRRAAVGAFFLNRSLLLARSRCGRHHPLRTCVERGGAVRSALGHR